MSTTPPQRHRSLRQKLQVWSRRRRRRLTAAFRSRKKGLSADSLVAAPPPSQRPHDTPAIATTPGPAPAPRQRGRWRRAHDRWKRFSLLRFLAKWTAWGVVVCACLLMLAYGLVVAFVDGEDIRRWLVDAVEQQTGARLVIESSSFDANTGVTFKGIAFYPPKIGEPLGFRNGGAVHPSPLLKVDMLKVHYDLPALLLARIRIKAIQLVNPHINLSADEGQYNFAGIVSFRERYFPQASEPAPAPPTAESSDKFQLPSFIPIHPKHIYSPVSIEMNNIGIAGMSVHVTEASSSKGTSEITAGAFNLDLGLQWHGNVSKIYAKFSSAADAPLAVQMQKTLPGQQHAAKLLEVTTKLGFEMALHNLSTLKLSLDNHLATLHSTALSLGDLKTTFSLVASLFDDLKGVQLESIALSVGDILDYQLSGSVALPAGNFERVHLDIKQGFSLFLDGLQPIARKFRPDLELAGTVELSDFTIKGELLPERFNDVKTLPLPLINGKLLVNGLTLVDAQQGLKVQELNATTNLSVTPSLSGQGSQMDTMVDLSLGGIGLDKDSPLGRTHLAISELSSRLLARLTFPELSAPIVKLNVEAPHVRVDNDTKTLVDVPLYADIDAEYDPIPQLMSATLRSELGELAVLNLMADCQQNCQKLRTHSQVNLNALDKLLSIAGPIAQQLGKGDLLPTKLAGTVAWQFDLKGTLPPLAKLNKESFFEEAALTYFTQLNFDRITTELPMMLTKLKNFEARLSLQGDLAQQSLRFNQSFEELSLQLPAAAASPALPITVSRFAFETNLANKTSKLSDHLPTLVAGLASELTSNLHIGRVHLPSKLPYPIDDFSFGVGLKHNALAEIQIEKLKVALPAFGFNFLADIATTFSPNLLTARLPSDIKGDLQLAIQHGGGERLPGGIETSGKIAVNTHFASTDMQKAYIEGETSFDHFNLKVSRTRDNKTDELVAVEDMVGKIPFKQLLDITPFLKPAAGAVADQVAPASTDGIADLSSSIAAYWLKNTDTLTKTTNAMSLADYPSIRPFYPDKKPIHIKAVRAANLTMTELECDVELRQNWFSLNQFMMDFLGGKVHGSFQVAFDPLVHSLKTSLHLTRLNSHKLLDNFPNLKKKHQGASLVASDPYIDATVHFNYDLRQNDMAGGIDISSIGKEQLKMILYYVDPQEQDATIGKIRTALSAGDVESVAIPIKNGEIDIDVRLKLLGLPLPIPKINRIPVAKILDNMMGKPKAADASKSQTAMGPPPAAKA